MIQIINHDLQKLDEIDIAAMTTSELTANIETTFRLMKVVKHWYTAGKAEQVVADIKDIRERMIAERLKRIALNQE